MFKVLKISGNSLSPEYQEGDFVIATRIPFFFNQPKRGDVVVFDHPAYGVMIKRVDRLTPDGLLFVKGNHQHSIDSRVFGAIQRTFLVGKVIWHFKKKLRRTRPD